ncbi:MBL fold metallo-hydrolase [Pseudonocardia sp. C8]|uniref:alkyl sulfatase dimerization domain-containing protein n=1 Tax=Pseudonocardia sp. C8 TaxID=2762759 RepID=UPI0016425688|nr:alkyl sulfatase dimerization domain-containing protein [Pseudonocardia sp. C8]MBC3190425.1 MBL fold metallo-hydrolase [Pseudonocardia sp. C8]
MTDILEYADQAWSGQRTLRDYHRGALREHGLHAVADGIFMWPAFGNVYVLPTSDGLFVYDTGDRRTADELYAAVRALTPAPIHTAVYSHGHVDHVFGMAPFDAEADGSGRTRPTVLAHEAVVPRFDRYRLTAGHNQAVNRRQFQAPGFRWPATFRQPDITYADRTTLSIGDERIELHHARGETDDATIAWLPERKALFSGDFFIWSSPNAGNPQKVQRYARDWARALTWMASLGAEILLPGHGLPVVGVERIRTTLLEAAELLEAIHGRTLDLMNSGATLDEILRAVRTPTHLLEKPYLRPSYDEPEFVVRNIWRLYGGWYDGNPAHLKPAPQADLAAELAALCGGADALAQRALELVERGEHRLAGHLAQFAADSSGAASVHEARATVFSRLEQAATSTMAKGVYAWAVVESRAALAGTDEITELEAKVVGTPRWSV